MLTFICYIEVYFTFAFLDCLLQQGFRQIEVCYIKVLFHTLQVHFIILAGLKKTVRYTEKSWLFMRGLSVINPALFTGLSKEAGYQQKSPPTWLVSASYSVWHFFTDDIFK